MNIEERFSQNEDVIAGSGIVNMEAATCILDDCEVPDAKERVDWFNVTTLDLEDLIRVAEVKFQVYICEHCGAKGWEGKPDNWADFQGVWDEEAVAPIDGDFMGKPFYVVLCDDCLGKVQEILDI